MNENVFLLHRSRLTNFEKSYLLVKLFDRVLLGLILKPIMSPITG